MAKQTKKFRKVIQQVEVVVGHPVLTRDPGDSDDTAPAPPVFIAVFGNDSGSTHSEVFGSGVLTTSTIVLVDPDTVDRLNDGATPTMVGFAWVDGSTNRTQSRSVRNFGHRETDDASGEDFWAIELSSATSAPLPGPGIPEGSSPASAWCILFPWLSMCSSH